MALALLSTKLHIPTHRLGLVPRPRLIERLESRLPGKLTLVSAPAGFGKTTLVSAWIRDCGHPVAWLSLDKNDNELSRFLTYLIAAVQRVDVEIGVDLQAALAESLSPQFDILLTRLISEIEVISEPWILVLDDYHLIDSKSVHDALNFLVEYLPPEMHLVIAGRTDPPLPISRLRVQGKLSEIRTPDLRFTKAEVAAFLNDLMGFNLSSKDIDTLERRTEGWVASLQLAALSMQERDDRHKFIAEFSGSHRYIIDYLMDEVMARQPEDVQVFLRRTSILERICAPLCEAVVGEGGTGGKGIIDHLDRSNLFLIPLDDHREWYRYHHLFADFLGQRLHEVEPKRIPELHSRASQWYEDEGWVDEAIQHALAAADLEAAIRLVDRIAADLVVRRESNKLIKLVEQLPADRCRNHPMLCLWHAWALLFMGQLEAVEPVLEIVGANPEDASGIPIPGYVSTIRAYLANQRGHLEDAIDLSERALDLLSDAQSDRITLIFRGAVVIWLGVNHRLVGNMEKASQLFVEATSLNQAAGNIYGALAAIEQSADLAVTQGQLHQALDFYKRGFQIAQSWRLEQGRGLKSLVAASGLHLGLGAVFYQMNDLVGAAPHIRRAVELEELGENWSKFNAYKLLAYLNQAEGDFVAAHNLLKNIFALMDTAGIHQFNLSLEPGIYQLGILLSRSNPEMAHLLPEVTRRIEAMGLHPEEPLDFSGPPDYALENNYSELARLFIALDRAIEALPLLARLLEAARAMRRQGDEIRYLVLIALVHHRLEDIPSALDSLRQALTLAEPQDYVRIFVDEGQPMAVLLQLAISQDIVPDYTSKLLAAFSEDVRSSIEIETEGTNHAQSLVEPLSEREIQVLRLIAGGYKYQEIAEQLVISLNTVRHHTRNVYSKLNVNNRARAIDRAKELDLL